jgi:hypothetical protein
MRGNMFDLIGMLSTRDVLEWVRNSVTLGGIFGGLYFLWDKYKNRVRVEISDVKYFTDENPAYHKLRFTAENMCDQVTSLRTPINFNAYEPRKGARVNYKFTLNYNERNLNPFDARLLTAICVDGEKPNVSMLWFVTIDFALTRGRTYRLRLRNVDRQRLSWLKFHTERLRLVVLGTVP